MEWRREGQHSAGNIDHKYADSRNMQEYNVRPTLVYSWKASFVQAGTRGLSGTDASDREKQLEQENKRLKEMVADLALANELLKKGRTRL